MTPGQPFYTSIADHYDRIFPLSPAQREFVKHRLPDGGTVLDIGCGTGSLALALAETHPIHGIDLDPAMVEKAQEKQRQSGLKAAFHVGDMLALDSLFDGARFSAVICLGNTLSHLPRDDRKRFFREAHGVLETGGILITQSIHYERLVSRDLFALPTIDNEHVEFVRRYEEFDGVSPFAFSTRLTVKKDHSVIENRVTLYPLSATELAADLSEAGFRNTDIYGSLAGEPLGDDSYPVISVSQKK